VVLGKPAVPGHAINAKATGKAGTAGKVDNAVNRVQVVSDVKHRITKAGSFPPLHILMAKQGLS